MTFDRRNRPDRRRHERRQGLLDLQQLQRQLDRVWHLLRRVAAAVLVADEIELDIPAGIPEDLPEGPIPPGGTMSTRITQNQRVLFGPITGRNKRTQQPEPLDPNTTPTVTSQRTNILIIEAYEPDPVGNPGVTDPNYFWAKATGNLDPDTPGDPVGLTTCPVDVSADADLGDGVKLVSRQLQVEVVDAGAGDLDIPAGTPEDLP